MQSFAAPPARFAMLLTGLAVLVAWISPPGAEAQVVAARRMGMGGVVLSHGGEGSAQNIAYRAVPRGTNPTSLPVPLGLVQYAVDPPVFNVNDPDFNALELANDLLNPPWHLQLYEPSTPSSDVLIEISRNSLVFDLDDLQRAIPNESMEHGGVLRFPGLHLSLGPAFLGVNSYSQVGHTMKLDPEFHAALVDASPFVGGRRYSAEDAGQAQAFLSFNAGAAVPIVSPPEDTPYESDAFALYGGGRVKYLRGIGYLDAHNVAGFTTNDTLFGADPVDVDFNGIARYTGTDDLFSGSGYGLDLGAVMFYKRFEFGLGFNDLVHQVTWTVDVDSFRFNPILNDIETIPVAENLKIDGSFPITWNASVAYRPRHWTLAASAVKNVGTPSLHLGAERWLGIWAVRAGSTLDSRQLVQFSAGTGVHLGPVGVDLGFATHSRTITEQRGLEMGMSFVLYGGGK